MNLNDRLPNSIIHDYLAIYEELKSIENLVLYKYCELTAIRLMHYLESECQNYKIEITLHHDVDENFYYFIVKCQPPKYLPPDQIDQNLHDKIKRTLLIPEKHLGKFYKKIIMYYLRIMKKVENYC